MYDTTYSTSSLLKQHEKTQGRVTVHKTDERLSDPRQWIVIKGQCIPLKQELEENASSVLVKQENHVVERQCLQIKEESEEKACSIFVKQENPVAKGQSLSLKQELEENDNSI